MLPFQRAAALTLLLSAPALAQDPGRSAVPASSEADARDLTTRMMAFDADKNGALTRPEVTDPRLLLLFDRADADHDATVTPAELAALAHKEHSDQPDFDAGPGPGGGPPPGGGPRPGEILPARLQDQLKLTDAQKHELDNLQKQTVLTLEKILTDDQRQQLTAPRGGGPGGPPPGGPGGPGRRGPGGPMGFMRPGEVLPARIRERIKLSDDQTARLDAYQKEVDSALTKILTDAQREELKALAERGPGPGGPPPR
jgi:hypothetical protein